MKKIVRLLALPVLAAACQDAPQKVSPIEPEPVAASAQALAPSFSVGADSGNRSAVCVAYDSRLSELRAQLEQNPSDEDLQAGVEMFEQITQSCE